MNNLSWLIYASDVVEGIKVASAMIIMAAVFVLLFTGIARMSLDADDDIAIVSRRAGRKAFWVVAIAAPLAILTPSQTTMYAIAASEVGERIAARPDVQAVASDATKAVQLWIKSQLDGAKK